MVRARHLTRIAIGAWLLAAAVPARAAEQETRFVARDLQRAERLVAAALETQDESELKAQSLALSRLAGRIPDSEEMGTRVSCGVAVQQLANVVDAWSGSPSARKRLAADADLRLYRESMRSCETSVELAPPKPPHLR